MCGRFTLKSTPQQLAETFDLAELPADLGPRYNIAPSLEILAVPNEPVRKAELFRWGLVPRWAADPSIGNRLINARIESVTQKPAFREAARLRRCLVLADGFYEWRTSSQGKTPFHFHLPSEKPFGLAGLWETWTPRGTPPGQAAQLHTCCLLTTAAQGVVAPVHDRMPILVAPEHIARWLDPRPLAPEELLEVLDASAALALQATQVSRYVNVATHEGPQCIEPAMSTGFLPM